MRKCVKPSEVSIETTGGSNIVHAKPIFSTDSKYIIYASGFAVKVSSISTGECIQVLRAHTKRVTAIVQNPNNQYQIFTSSLDKQIIKWDFKDGVLLSTYNFEYPIIALRTVREKFAAIQAKDAERSVILFSFEKKSVVDRRVIIQNAGDTCLAFASGCKDDIVATIEKNFLKVYSLSTKATIEHTLTRNHLLLDKVTKAFVNTTLTCVACHPTERCIATGTGNGDIVLWYNITKKSPRQNLRRWHALPVVDLAFSPSGSFLLSGGHECVLVKWTLSTSTRDTKPRMGAPICAVIVSPDGTTYSTCHNDNSIQVLTSSFIITQCIQGLTAAFTRSRLLAGLHYDTRTRSLVSNGRPGHLQFYDIKNDKQMYNLDIVGQNYVSSALLSKPLVLTEIQNMAFSAGGEWLATMERRDDGETSPEMRLKFWHYDTEKQIFALNTLIEHPHSSSSHSLKFRHRSPGGSSEEQMLVSTSADGKFKLWTLRDDTDIYRENMCWSCDSQGHYKNQACGACDFSADGSLLAVAFNTTLTLWDPDTISLRHTHSTPGEIRWLHMSSGSCSHYVMFATSDCVYAFNLLSCTIEWTYECDVSLMTSSPDIIYSAVFTDDEKLLVFSPKSSAPLYIYTDLSSAAVHAAIFIPTPRGDASSDDLYRLPWLPKHTLYFLNAEQELLTFGVGSKLKTSSKRSTVTQKLPENPLTLLLTSDRKVDAKDVKLDVIGAKIVQSGSTFLQEMLLTPAHVLPPVSSLCMAFHQTLFLPGKHSSLTTNGVKKVSDNDDVSSDDDDDDTSDESDMDTNDDVIVKTGNKYLVNKAMTSALKTDLIEDVGNKAKNVIIGGEEIDLNYTELSKRTFSWMNTDLNVSM